MKTSEILSDAKAYVAGAGWTRGVMVSREGYCMLGAVDKALTQRSPVTEDHIEAWTAAKEILRGKIFEMFPGETPFDGDSFSVIAEFNDSVDRTLPEVFEVFDKAIAACVERGE